MNENAEPAPSGETPAAERSGAAPPAGTGGLPGETPPRDEDTFPIVGIGASAGGLRALEQFLAGVPPGSGMAYVVVQHLDPTQKGMLPELLQRITPMPVVQVTEPVAVRPETVYVIPPGRDLALHHRNLHLLEPHEQQGLRLPIDFLFRSLAADLAEQSIGVVLSGMGSDGTAGLRAIKEKAGLALVQDPATAEFDGMPRSAIHAELADIVAPAEELPGRILAFVQHRDLRQGHEAPAEPEPGSAVDQVLILLRARTGHDFSLYKEATVHRRIERRMAIHQLDRVADYVRFLRENPAELDLLFKELLIGVTSFFRDPAIWEALRDRVIPDLIAAAPGGATLRAWVVGCSTGEEAYSLAIVFKEALDAAPAKECGLQIYATDLDRDAIDRARTGLYPENIAADVSEERLGRFFVREEPGYRVLPEVREMVTFAPQNVITDPPFTRLDLLSCRNLLIYLKPEVQRKLIPLFHYALKPEGVLTLGTAETIGSATNLFAPIDPRLRLYRRLEAPNPAPAVEFPTAFAHHGPGAVARAELKPGVDLQTLADQVILQRFAPAAVLTTGDGDILYTNGRTGRFLEPAAGKANWNVFAMTRDALRLELGGAFRQALRQDEPVVLHGVRVGTNGGTVSVDVTVQRLLQPAPLKGLVLIVLAEAPAPAEPPARSRRSGRREELRDLEERLRHAEEDLQTTREEMQTSQEELKSTNEELQSTNEELQSTNEELTTSKEEMQSMNEELQSVNTELESRVTDLSHVNDDMKNLLNNTGIATVFLDGVLNLRWFTTGMTKLVNLRPTDTGRPLTDIASDLFYPELPHDAREVLRTLVPAETEVTVRDGRRFSVRITPYRTLENRIDGVVVTFTDITAFRELERGISEARAYAEGIVTTVREPLLVLNGRMRVISANRSFYRAFRILPGEVEGRELYALGNGGWDLPELRLLLERVLPENEAFEDFRVEHDFPAVGRRVLLLNARRIITEATEKELILLAFEDVTGTARDVTP